MFNKIEKKETMGVKVTPSLKEEFKETCKNRELKMTDVIEFLMKDFNKPDFLERVKREESKGL